jgi:DNA mismatch repair protein MSH4
MDRTMWEILVLSLSFPISRRTGSSCLPNFKAEFCPWRPTSNPHPTPPATQIVVDSLIRMATSHGQIGTRSTTIRSYPLNKRTPTNSRPFTGRSRPRTAATAIGVGENEIICAISESRGISPTIGLSFVNISTSEAVLCQFTDTQTYARTCHKIKVFWPSEIIYMKTAVDSKLLSIIRETLEVDKYDILMMDIDRQYWSDSIGHEYVQQLAFPDDLESLKVAIGGNYFAACCFAAVGVM